MITAASVQGQVATGDRAGQRVRRRLIDPQEGVRSGRLIVLCLPWFFPACGHLRGRGGSSPDELLEKLAAPVPPPRLNLVRYHGVLAPHAADRAQIVPGAKQEVGISAWKHE